MPVGQQVGSEGEGGKYRELVSCSNCTDYQARAMQTKFGYRPEDPFCHMLNSTLCATERAMCCIVENDQEEDGPGCPEPKAQVITEDLAGTTSSGAIPPRPGVLSLCEDAEGRKTCCQKQGKKC